MDVRDFSWSLWVNERKILHSTKDLHHPEDDVIFEDMNHKKPLCSKTMRCLYEAFANRDAVQVHEQMKSIINTSIRKPALHPLSLACAIADELQTFPLPLCIITADYCFGEPIRDAIVAFAPPGLPVTVHFVALFFKYLLVKCVQFADDEDDRLITKDE